MCLVSNNKNKLDSKSKQLIVAIFAFLILLTFSAVMLIAAYNFGLNNKNPESTNSDPRDNEVQLITDNVTTTNANPTTTENITVPETKSDMENQSTEVQVSVEGLEEFTKTGDNQISDSPNNEFIKLVVDTKGVDSKNLVAIYAVPDLGNNFVLEFSGKKDDNGNILRSPKTLKRIYHINKEREITIATGKPTGNEGVDYGTSLMTYYLVTDVVMPEFPDYFTDVG